MSKEKQLLIDCIPFNVRPEVIQESIEKNGKVIVSGVLQKANAKNQNGRVYPRPILEREVKKYLQSVKERRAMGECVPAGIKIYTIDGWKNIEDVRIGEKIYTFNLETNTLEIQSISDKIEKHYKDDLIRFHNDRNLDFIVTKKHKIVLWNRNHKPYTLTAEELYERLNENDSVINHSYIKYSGKWVGEYEEYFKVPNSNVKIKSEDWAAFLGLFIAEGHCEGTKSNYFNGNIVGISQTIREKQVKVIELLDRLPFEYTTSNGKQFLIKDKNLYNHLRPLGNSYEKYIPEYAKNWSVDLLKILFEWMLLGDGRNRKNYNGKLIKEYSTVSDQLSEDVYEIILKMGYGATINTIIPKDRYISDITEMNEEIENEDGTLEIVKQKVKVLRLIKGENSRPLKTIHLRTTNGTYLDNRFIKSEKVPFNDKVYCVSVSNRTWLMKYNGKVCWTHNCDHPNSSIVELKNVSHNILEMHWEGDNLVGTIEVLSTPAGNILKELFKNGIKLGISSRALGTTEDVDGYQQVQEDLDLIAFDFVSNPSTHGAFMKPLNEGKESVKVVNPYEKVDKIITEILLEI